MITEQSATITRSSFSECLKECVKRLYIRFPQPTRCYGITIDKTSNTCIVQVGNGFSLHKNEKINTYHITSFEMGRVILM